MKIVIIDFHLKEVFHKKKNLIEFLYVFCIKEYFRTEQPYFTLLSTLYKLLCNFVNKYNVHKKKLFHCKQNNFFCKLIIEFKKSEKFSFIHKFSQMKIHFRHDAYYNILSFAFSLQILNRNLYIMCQNVVVFTNYVLQGFRKKMIILENIFRFLFSISSKLII